MIVYSRHRDETSIILEKWNHSLAIILDLTRIRYKDILAYLFSSKDNWLILILGRNIWNKLKMNLSNNEKKVNKNQKVKNLIQKNKILKRRLWVQLNIMEAVSLLLILKVRQIGMRLILYLKNMICLVPNEICRHKEETWLALASINKMPRSLNEHSTNLEAKVHVKEV